MDETAQAMKHLHAGSLHVGASPTCATYYLPPRLAEFMRHHPGIKLNVAVEPSRDLNRGVAAGTLDCAFIASTPDPGLVAFELARDELVMVAHRDHPLSQRRRITAADLVSHLYLGPRPRRTAGSPLRTMMGDAYDRVEALNLGHPEYVRAAAIAGLGFAALPRRAVAPEIDGGVLKRLPIPPITRSISAVRRGGRGGPVLEAFWAMLTGGGVPASGKISSDGRGNP